MGNRRRKKARRRGRRSIGGEAQAQRIIGQRADQIVIDDPYSGVDRSIDRDRVISWWHDDSDPNAPAVYFTTEPTPSLADKFARGVEYAMQFQQQPMAVMPPSLYAELERVTRDANRKLLRTPEQVAADDRVDAIAYAYRAIASRSEIAAAIARFDASNVQKSTSGYPQPPAMPRRR